MKLAVFFLSFFALPIFVFGATVSVLPENIIQGDPVLIEVSATSTSKVFFSGVSVPVFNFKNKKEDALFGIDLNKTPGDYPLIVKFGNRQLYKSNIKVLPRVKKEAPLGIPERLGGNTVPSQNSLMKSLTAENFILSRLKTGAKVFWSKPFSAPLTDATVTDPYGYSRITGQYLIPHKGVDFRASIGTKVFAMNRGVVRLVRDWRVYGKTVVIDHGLGLQTLYMHLSKIYVDEGELVLPGQKIGLSGDSGYAETPHLHVSVKIGGISVDPIKFLQLFSLF